MKLKLLFLLLAISLAGFAQPYSSNRIAVSNGTIIPLTIDGKFNEPVWTVAGYNPSANTFPHRIFNNLPYVAVDSSLFKDVYVTFGTLWDKDYLYIGVAVDDPRLADILANNPDFPFNTNAGKISIYYSTKPVGSRSQCDDPTAENCSPSKLGLPDFKDFECELNFDFQKVARTLKPGGNGFSSNYGTTWSDTSYTAYIVPTSKGYNLEIALKWNTLNRGYIDPLTFQYTDAGKAPQAGVDMGFDIAYNAYSITGVRQARLMWNQCCTNTNWSMSYYYGTMSLTGVGTPPPPPNAIALSPNPLNISNGQPAFLTATPSPSGADSRVKYSAINPAGGAVIKIGDDGSVIPLKNGTATVLGTAFKAPTVTGTAIVNVTGMASPASVTVFGNDINVTTANWASTTFTATVSPSNAAQDVIWSVMNPGNLSLAIINSVTGVLTSLSNGNGSVTVLGTSLADFSVIGIKVVQINTPVLLASCLVTITSFQGLSPCRGLNDATIAGFSLNNPVSFRMIYGGPNTTLTGIVPPEFVKYSFSKAPSNLVVSGNYNESQGTYDIFSTLNTSNSPVTLTGEFIYNPEIKTYLELRVNNSATTTSGACISIPPRIDVAPCQEGEVKSGIDFNKNILIFPNPAEGEFTIQIIDKNVIDIEVINAFGSPVKQLKNIEKEARISGLPPGFYLVKVNANGKFATAAVIVK